MDNTVAVHIPQTAGYFQQLGSNRGDEVTRKGGVAMETY